MEDTGLPCRITGHIAFPPEARECCMKVTSSLYSYVLLLIEEPFRVSSSLQKRGRFLKEAACVAGVPSFLWVHESSSFWMCLCLICCTVARFCQALTSLLRNWCAYAALWRSSTWPRYAPLSTQIATGERFIAVAPDPGHALETEYRCPGPTPLPFPELIGLEGALGFGCKTVVENIALIGRHFDSNSLAIFPDLDKLWVKTCSGECVNWLGQNGLGVFKWQLEWSNNGRLIRIISSKEDVESF